MAIVGKSHFDRMANVIGDRKVALVGVTQNSVGDQLIEKATQKFFKDYEFVQTNPEKADVLIFCGGGNLGDFYPAMEKRRRKHLNSGKPVIIFPQSINGKCFNLERYEHIFLRDWVSMDLSASYGGNPGSNGNVSFAPDMALYFDKKECIGTKTGYFLRKDREARHHIHPNNIGDPYTLFKGRTDFFDAVAPYKKIVTDRLHFAISSLLNGSETVLLPNSFYKNRAVWQAWLKDLGCQFANSIEET